MTASFFVSTAVVALVEIGDKTQLLALLLTTRFRRPLPIIAGILIATLANHAAAAFAGEWLAGRMEAQTLRWLIGGSFLAIAAWTLRADKLENSRETAGRYGVFIVTLIAFFLVEMGDKSQIATVILAAQYRALAAVVLGTTLGMMIANVPVVLVGNALAEHIPGRAVRIVAALLFTVLGVLALSGVGTN
jgi:Ca2+/H+ antiporter, TMEM165/GDT1 family